MWMGTRFERLSDGQHSVFLNEDFLLREWE